MNKGAILGLTCSAAEQSNPCFSRERDRTTYFCGSLEHRQTSRNAGFPCVLLIFIRQHPSRFSSGYYGNITEVLGRVCMARTVIDKRLAKREQRIRLAPQKEPYWMMLNEGEHLGYYRGFRVAKWVARFRLPQKGEIGRAHV